MLANRLRSLICSSSNTWHANSLSTTTLWPTGIIVDTKTKALEVEFNTGEKFRYPAELLRVESPAADAHKTFGKASVTGIVHGRRFVNILDVEPVGRYALRIQFDDLHGSGLFTWDFLHELGVHKRQRIKSYLKALKAQGLSRDPPQRPKTRPKQEVLTKR